mmetsp:Transcript_83542/g.250394  ORF Transcript_83542/g.250394 Transcript_83542/m.250394 type:complete len:209 (-) Transcript_83542:656-1282(-)
MSVSAALLLVQLLPGPDPLLGLAELVALACSLEQRRKLGLGGHLNAHPAVLRRGSSGARIGSRRTGGVVKLDRTRLQEEPTALADGWQRRHAALFALLARGGGGGPVQVIADDRRAERRRVHAQLVRAARVRREAHVRQHAPLRVRLAEERDQRRARREQRAVHLDRRADRHLVGRRADQQRLVLLEHRAALKLARERERGAARLGDE